MNEQGLAAQALGPIQPMKDINQVVAMLRQGTTPEELIQAGIPQEVVAEAMRIISQEATAIPREGLAGMSMAPNLG